MDDTRDTLDVPCPAVEGTALAVHRSALADELRRLPPKTRQFIHIPEVGLMLIEVVVVAAKVLTDSDDRRPWVERLETYPFPDRDEQAWAEFTRVIDSFDVEAVKPVIEEFARDGRQLFLKRLLGQAAYDRLVAALRVDAMVVLGAVQLGIEALRPMAVSMHDALAALPEKELERSGLTALGGHGVLSLVAQFDGLIGHVIEDVLGGGLPFDKDRFRDNEPSVEDLLRAADTLYAGRRCPTTWCSAWPG